MKDVLGRMGWWSLAMAASTMAGCTVLATRGEKARSFGRYESVRIGNISLENHLRARTALLALEVPIRRVRPDDGGDYHLEIEVEREDNKPVRMGFGSAAALTDDGYFLTARHCVSIEPVTVIVERDGAVEWAPARVVWVHPHGDLALIHAAVRPGGVFEWAPLPEAETTVAMMGCMTGPAAGEFRRAALRHGDRPARERYARIVHGAPLARSDSGGPLTTLDGGLLGVNTQAGQDILSRRYSIAIRPEVEVVEELILLDRGRRGLESSRRSLPRRAGRVSWRTGSVPVSAKGSPVPSTEGQAGS
jgi:S1-C subfamily serine protease